jgi:hypothetical protein
MFYLTTLSFGKIIRLPEQNKGRGIRSIGKMRIRAKSELLGEKTTRTVTFSTTNPT